MDVNYIKNVFIVKNCARTSGSDTIDTDTVTTMCQITAPLADAGTAANSYYGPGELVVTDESGLVLASGTALKTVPAIKIAQRSYDGEHTYGSLSLKGGAVVGYDIAKYVAPVEGMIGLNAIDVSLTDYSYTLKIRKIKTNDPNHDEAPVVKSFVFRSAEAGSTAAQIWTGLAAKVNAKLNTNSDDELAISATVVTGGSASDGMILTALPMPWELDKFKYGKYTFTVETNFTVTQDTNMEGVASTFNSGSYAIATEGHGTYWQVIEIESAAKGYTGANRDKMSENRARTIVGMDTQKYEDDGTTANRYDIININWEDDLGDLGRAFQQGSIVIALPVDDNGSNQQLDIVNTLNAYIVTNWGFPVAALALT